VGRGVYQGGVSHAIAFAQMRRAVCQRQLSFLFVICLVANVSDCVLENALGVLDNAGSVVIRINQTHDQQQLTMLDPRCCR